MFRTVLLVEDEPTARNFVIACLERENMIVLAASDGAEAVDIFRSRLKIDLLLTDVNMGSGISGFEVAKIVLEEKPETKVLVISGYPDREAEAAKLFLPFLPKPFTPAILSEAVRKVFRLSTSSERTMSTSGA
jgi:CheY-like chemotaxis protein